MEGGLGNHDPFDGANLPYDDIDDRHRRRHLENESRGRTDFPEEKGDAAADLAAGIDSLEPDIDFDELYNSVDSDAAAGSADIPRSVVTAGRQMAAESAAAAAEQQQQLDNAGRGRSNYDDAYNEVIDQELQALQMIGEAGGRDGNTLNPSRSLSDLVKKNPLDLLCSKNFLRIFATICVVFILVGITLITVKVVSTPDFRNRGHSEPMSPVGQVDRSSIDKTHISVSDACSTAHIRTVEGMMECDELCEVAACCFASEGDHSIGAATDEFSSNDDCRESFDDFCDEYQPCTVIYHDDIDYDPESAEVQIEASGVVDEQEQGQTPHIEIPNVPPAPINLSELCHSSAEDGFAECDLACLVASCCFPTARGVSTPSCYENQPQKCNEYEDCHVIMGESPGFPYTEEVFVEMTDDEEQQTWDSSAPPELAYVCTRSDPRYNFDDCRIICEEASCCFVDDMDLCLNSGERHNVICDDYDACAFFDWIMDEDGARIEVVSEEELSSSSSSSSIVDAASWIEQDRLVPGATQEEDRPPVDPKPRAIPDTSDTANISASKTNSEQIAKEIREHCTLEKLSSVNGWVHCDNVCEQYECCFFNDKDDTPTKCDDFDDSSDGPCDTIAKPCGMIYKPDQREDAEEDQKEENANRMLMKYGHE